jgi:hypothetical protein
MLASVGKDKGTAPSLLASPSRPSPDHANDAIDLAAGPSPTADVVRQPADQQQAKAPLTTPAAAPANAFIAFARPGSRMAAQAVVQPGQFYGAAPAAGGRATAASGRPARAAAREPLVLIGRPRGAAAVVKGAIRRPARAAAARTVERMQVRFGMLWGGACDASASYRGCLLPACAAALRWCVP